MTEPWFDPNRYAWVFGAALGVLGGTLGSLAGSLAPRGKAKGLVLGLFTALLVACAVLLAAGIVALAQKQPYGVWYGLLLPGAIGLIVMGSLLPQVKRRYREAEERQLSARDLG